LPAVRGDALARGAGRVIAALATRSRLCRATAVALALSLAAAGCGAPFRVVSGPGKAEIFVDGRYVGSGGRLVEPNGIVFNPYHVVARCATGTLLYKDVDIRFSERSVFYVAMGLLGFFFLPLALFIPSAFFVGEPNPDKVEFYIAEGPLNE